MRAPIFDVAHVFDAVGYEARLVANAGAIISGAAAVVFGEFERCFSLRLALKDRVRVIVTSGHSVLMLLSFWPSSGRWRLRLGSISGLRLFFLFFGQ
jgi:hypothetical protein